jgi:hypothetical protein
MNHHFLRIDDLASDITTALQIATELEDTELIANGHLHRASIYLGQEKYELADADAQEAMRYIDQLQTPLKGNLYLINATVGAHFAAEDKKQEKQVKDWLDKATNLAWKAKQLEGDRTFQVLNLSGIHHERAKILLQFHEFRPNVQTLEEASSEMTTAWKTLSPDVAVWKMYFQMTEARLYKANHDLEGSAQTGIEALKTARAFRSKKEETQVRALYDDLNGIDEMNPYVRNLGLELGIF